LGFANRVRKGPIGLVAASGTGLQQVSARLHQLGSGITHALGTGGRDLSEAVGAVTVRQGLDLLGRDPETQVIVLVTKPPSPQVADDVLRAVRLIEKPIVVDFIGASHSVRHIDHVRLATTLDEAAELAVQAAGSTVGSGPAPKPPGFAPPQKRYSAGQRYVRGLFSGGTLAYEAQVLLQSYVPVVHSNAPLMREHRLRSTASAVGNAMTSEGHTILDLGDDEFTVGRLHPMMDNDLRIRRLLQEADDPEVAILLLDVVLGYGAHPDPAAELAPAIARACASARAAGRSLMVVAVVVGTDADPQGMGAQVERLEAAGVRVETCVEAAIQLVGRTLQALNPQPPPFSARPIHPVDLCVLRQPMAAINVGLESFADSLRAQGAEAIQVDWRPPAGGNEALVGILGRMKGEA
jgi:FdrA protein